MIVHLVIDTNPTDPVVVAVFARKTVAKAFIEHLKKGDAYENQYLEIESFYVKKRV